MKAAAASKSQLYLAQFVIAVAIALAVLAIAWYGLSAESYQRMLKDILARPGGPMTFRFILQPTMAVIAALHDGIRDADLGRAPFLQTVLFNREKRGERLREGLISTARIILLGFVMDGIYQFTVLQTFYPGEMLIVALLLAFVPYLLLRGPIARAARLWAARKSDGTIS